MRSLDSLDLNAPATVANRFKREGHIFTSSVAVTIIVLQKFRAVAIRRLRGALGTQELGGGIFCRFLVVSW